MTDDDAVDLEYAVAHLPTIKPVPVGSCLLTRAMCADWNPLSMCSTMGRTISIMSGILEEPAACKEGMIDETALLELFKSDHVDGLLYGHQYPSREALNRAINYLFSFDQLTTINVISRYSNWLSFFAAHDLRDALIMYTKIKPMDQLTMESLLADVLADESIEVARLLLTRADKTSTGKRVVREWLATSVATSDTERLVNFCKDYLRV